MAPSEETDPALPSAEIVRSRLLPALHVGRLGPGDRVPSVRRVASLTGLNPEDSTLAGAAAGVPWWLGIPWSTWAFPLWGVLAAAPRFVLGRLIVQGAGRFGERLDPSQEILELGR